MRLRRNCWRGVKLALPRQLRDRQASPADLRPIPDDGDANRACYNDELEAIAEDDKRWFTMNWLFAECYL